MTGRLLFYGLPAGVLALNACATVDPVPHGTRLAPTATIQADPTTVAEILNLFRGFEEAVRRGDLDGIMSLYADEYVDRGYTKASLRKEWAEILDQYHQFSTDHVVTHIAVDAQRPPSLAWITCTGSLSAINKVTGQRVTLDEWYREIHYAIHEDGKWRIQGSASEAFHQPADPSDENGGFSRFSEYPSRDSRAVTG